MLKGNQPSPWVARFVLPPPLDLVVFSKKLKKKTLIKSTIEI
jgi:hypothetical protein